MNDKLNSNNFFLKNNKNIYLIGGAFRHICKKYLSISNNPIEVIHSFTIKKIERSKFIKFLNYEFKLIRKKIFFSIKKRTNNPGSNLGFAENLERQYKCKLSIFCIWFERGI
ncbi:hypothetical protein CM15mP43_00350 [bacterium]|nr:MAG: hypothetical protein CM15mP43_00350 [bacterium]